jgi:hypothetical protein
MFGEGTFLKLKEDQCNILEEAISRVLEGKFLKLAYNQ